MAKKKKTVSSISTVITEGPLINYRHLILLFIISSLSYCNIFWNEFTYDDHLVIENNPNIRAFDGILKITFKQIGISEWQQSDEAALRGWIYRPLSFFIFYLIGKIFSIQPLWYHLFSVIFHCFNTLLVYIVCKMLKMRAELSLISAGIFAAHPVHTEAVTSIMSMPEEFMFFFSMLSFIMFLSKTKHNLLYSSIFYAAAIFSKETAVILVIVYFILYLYSNYNNERIQINKKEMVKIALIFLMPVVIYFIMRRHVTGAFLRNPNFPQSIVDSPLLGATSKTRILTAIYALSQYLLLFFYPTNLCADYSYGAINLVTSIIEYRFLIALLILLIVIVLFIFLLLKRRYISAIGIAIFYIALFPLSNLMYVAGTIMAERYLYLPSFGLSIFVADSIGWINSIVNKKYKNIIFIVIALLIIVLVVSTIIRNRVWRNDFELFSDVVKKKPYNVKALYNLASLYNAKREFSSTIPLYQRMIQVYPTMPEAHASLIYAYYNSGRIKEAIETAYKATTILPKGEMFYDLLANLYIEVRMYNEAKNAYIMGIKNIPDSPFLYYNLAMLYYKEGNYKEASLYFSNALRYKDADDIHYYLGKCLFNLGEKNQALSEFIKSRRVANRFPEIYKYIAILSIELELYEQAAEAAEQFIYKFPQSADAYAVKALTIYSISKDINLARQYFDNAISMNPSLCTMKEYSTICDALK